MAKDILVDGELGENQLLVTEEEGANRFLIQDEGLEPTIGIGDAPRNMTGFFFRDDDGDWAVGTMAEARGHVRGVVFRDADGDVAIDTVIPSGGKPVETLIDWGSLEVTVL